MPAPLQPLGHLDRMLDIIEPGTQAEVLTQAQHQLHNPPVRLNVRLEHVVLGHFALPVPRTPLGRLAELERVNAELHLLQPLPQTAHLVNKLVIYTF